MPITASDPFRAISQEEFARIDYQVMRHAFNCQNELGRLCDELIYQNDLAARLRSAGFTSVRTEVPVRITHGTFAKTYFFDLVVDESALYEIKTAHCLIGEHEAQLLNYLCLQNLNHGKLLNFGPSQVESRFVNTQLSDAKRKQLRFELNGWKENDEASLALRKKTTLLLQDWGGFLDINLYVEALIHLFGGEGQVLQPLLLSRTGLPLGNQRFLLIAPRVAFRVTALLAEIDAFERQLQALLSLTNLHCIQWINLGRHDIQFRSIVR